jgi:acetyl esterase/lipase
MSVRRIILQELVDSNPKEIILVGHSAGGAMASLAFIDIKHLYPDTPLNAVTFGMLRVFNAEGDRWYSTYRDNFIRVVNGRDPIPNMPPVLFGYRHIGRLVRTGSRPFWKIYSIKDHHPGYSDELEELLRQEGIDPSSLGY